ncbi:Lipid A core-O-antigen ligase and related enzymes [[Clostridium] sordellii]|uniref:O-antigen ligase family protein n=1 Tax=Paraclostridium sordellii TaxID=1505 RepID=UPI0005440894|nr:O-antigen ligase family protein [Paeniclostridium sordellii]CEK31591.1 Lipid A core-O-antigen ligase and related enzymes [[Clostridium] sordellii] [Paeniclostridium sordellii]
MIRRIENLVNYYIIFILSVALWPFLSYLGVGNIDGILKYFALLCMFNSLLITLLRDMKYRYLGNILYNLKYVIVLIITIITSSLWSINKESTIQNSLYLILTTAYAIYLYMSYPLKDILKMMTKVMFIIALLSIVIVNIFPQYGMNMYPNWNGIYSQKNTLGRMMVIGIICSYTCLKTSYFENKINKIFNISTLILCIINLIFSGSTTSIASIIIIYTFSRLFKFKKKLLSLIIFLCIAIIIFVFINNSYLFSSLFELIHKDPNLTGRIGIWEISINRIKESNLMGYGFTASWDTNYMNRFNYYKSYMTNSHNGILQLMLDIGLIGTLIYIFIFLSTLAKNSVDFCENKYENMGLYLILLYLFFTNFFEALTIQSFSIVWVFQLISILHVEPNFDKG